MSRVPSHVRLVKDKWAYHLEISTETLKAFNGRLDEGILRADAAVRLREIAGCTEPVSLPPGVIVAEPDEDGLKIIVDPGREAATQEAVLLDYDESPIGVVAVVDGHAAAPLSRAKPIGIDTVTGLPAYMAP